MVPSINKIAHGVVPNISSVKDAVEKMASRYATASAAAPGSTKLGTIIKPPYRVTYFRYLQLKELFPPTKITIVAPILNESFLNVSPVKNCGKLWEQLEDTYTSNSNQGKSQKKSNWNGNRVFLDLKHFADNLERVKRITRFWQKTCTKQKNSRM